MHKGVIAHAKKNRVVAAMILEEDDHVGPIQLLRQGQQNGPK